MEPDLSRPPRAPGPRRRPSTKLYGCRFSQFETNGLKALYFQGVEIERLQRGVFNLHRPYQARENPRCASRVPMLRCTVFPSATIATGWGCGSPPPPKSSVPRVGATVGGTSPASEPSCKTNSGSVRQCDEATINEAPRHLTFPATSHRNTGSDNKFFISRKNLGSKLHDLLQHSPVSRSVADMGCTSRKTAARA